MELVKLNLIFWFDNNDELYKFVIVMFCLDVTKNCNCKYNGDAVEFLTVRLKVYLQLKLVDALYLVLHKTLLICAVPVRAKLNCSPLTAKVE